MKAKLILTIIALILMCGISFAVTTSATISAGSLSVSVTESSLSFSRTLDGNDHSADPAAAGLSITATDATGSGNGWNLTVVNDAANFIAGVNTIGNASFKFNSSGISIAMLTGQAIDGTNGPLADTIASGAFSVSKKFAHANAGYGKGKYSVTVPNTCFTLDILADTAVGSYTGPVVTVSVVSGP
ncbi:MAG: hypothetical protein HYU63_00605 [Armatimonadetes bacterium]|nr:hypothetical protein [Armatimonadota bacterium]